MNWKAWTPYILGLIAAILIGQVWRPPLTVTIFVLFVILTWILMHSGRQMNDRLDRLERELGKKPGTPEPHGDLDELREHLDGNFDGAKDDREWRSENAEKDLKWRLDNLKCDLQNLEKALGDKIESSSNDAREELAELSNHLEVLDLSYTKQEATSSRQQLEFAQRLQKMADDLRELQADADNSWSVTGSRYSIVGWGPALDPYTLEELKRAYKVGSASDRVRLLRKLQTQHTLPYDLAVLAVRDSNAEVREWFARCGDFSPWISRKFQVQRSPGLALGANKAWSQPQEAHIAEANSRELVQIVLNDPDPFVRTCLHENSSVFYGVSDERWLKYFRDADQIGRLALLRNSKVTNGLVEKLFNLECSELGIDLNERIDLGLAFLSNAYRLHELKDRALLCEEHHPSNSSGPTGTLYDAETFLVAVWEHSSKWPRETGMPAAIYKSVAAPAHVKSSVYASCEDTSLKFCILDSCGWLDQETVDIALQDKDEGLKEHASTIGQKILAKNKEVHQKWFESEEQHSDDE